MIGKSGAILRSPGFWEIGKIGDREIGDSLLKELEQQPKAAPNRSLAP
jgi:hypothetical protein